MAVNLRENPFLFLHVSSFSHAMFEYESRVES